MDYFFTDNNWSISPTIEKSFALIDLSLCFVLWYVISTSPTELDQGELADFEDDDDGVLVLHDGRVVRNVSGPFFLYCRAMPFFFFVIHIFVWNRVVF